MGLDYSKAMLIRNAQHVSADVFVSGTKAAGKKLLGKESHITSTHLAYVEKHITAAKASTSNK